MVWLSIVNPLEREDRHAALRDLDGHALLINSLDQ